MDTCAGNVGLDGNPTSPGPAGRKENRRLVCGYGQDLEFNPQLPWYVLLIMVILNIQRVFYLASRCKELRDALSGIPGTRGIIDFYLRNGILANLLPQFF